MLTKVLVTIVLSGALLVAGDAAYREFGCPFEISCPLSGCCGKAPVAAPTGNCCVPQSESVTPVTDCCSLAKASATAAVPCCDAAYTYCTRTNTINEGCCSEFANGQFRCRITGELSKDSCCVPIE